MRPEALKNGGYTMELYSCKSSDARRNAQQNLCGRTHYVDDDTLRFHKSRIISARHTDGGLLFAIVTSDAKDYQRQTRGFRYVIFDLFGWVVERNPDKIDLEWFKTSAKAEKAMWSALNQLNAVKITEAAIRRTEKHHAEEMLRLHAEITKLILTEKVNAA